MGRLSTHVLDTAHGRPAAGMGFALFRQEANGEARGETSGEASRWTLLAEGATNADGRTDAPLLQGAAFRAGRHRLVFQVAAYFRAQGVALPDPPFLDEVTLEFGMAEGGHHHVPLLVSPFGYTTYRGS